MFDQADSRFAYDRRVMAGLAPSGDD